MQTFSKWLVWVTLSLIVLLVLALLIIPSDIVEHKFTTYEQAAAAGAFERQGLPDHLPKSARDIHSIRDLDHGGEVVTFRYGPDFDEFIASQATAPSRTAKSLGIRLWNDHFDNVNELIYLPRVSFYREQKQGSLLINRVQKIALYID